MAIRYDSITAVDDVFLKMLGGDGLVEDPNCSIAKRTSLRCGHVHRAVIRFRGFAKPSRLKLMDQIRQRLHPFVYGILIACDSG